MADFSPLICDWYRLNKRDLPWRDTDNPYFIWLSEIILQQTRVEQGMNYYLKFIRNYPSIVDLANATEQEVLNDWQGLGYYSRARNLHFTAKYVCEHFDGVFPKSYEEILNLKGIGTYTAAAVSSFAFSLPHAVLDGNVFRVLSRFFDISTAIDSSEGKKDFNTLAQDLLPINNASEHNQAIMEFGAMFCKPVNPDCLNCVLNSSCLAFKNQSVQNRPVKVGKIKVKKRFFHYFIVFDGENIILSKRTNKDIWQHLFEFPMIETDSEISLAEINEFSENNYNQTCGIDFIEKKHVLSHQHIFATFSIINVSALDQEMCNDKQQIVKINALTDFPLPRLIDRFLELNWNNIRK